jgi:hypothetical protein
VDLGLTQAIDGIERIMINLAGSQAINDQLSLQVQSFLTSALDSLAQHTTVAETLSQTTKTLIEERIPELERWHEVVKGHTLNLQNFRSNFEQSVTGLSSDRVEMSAVLSQVMALQEDIALAKARFPDVSSFRSSWIDTLLSAMALTKEARTTATQGIFETDAALAQDYAALVTAMSLVPTTDLTGFSFYARSVQGLLLNTLKTDEIQAQYDSSVERMLTILDLISSRRDALATVLANYPLSPSPLLEKLLAIVEDAKMGTATTALKSGDISTFMQLSVGALNPVDYISKETQTFLATDERLRPLTEKDLADSMSEVLTFERGDVSAAQGFEESRTKAIAALKNDLLRLDRLESILDRAEAQKAQL